MKTQFNLLDILRTKYVQVIKMIPLSNNIGTKLAQPLRISTYLSMGKLTGLAARVNATKSFISFVLKLYKNNGAGFTIKWLKAASVALQKYLGDDRLRSLRTIDPNLPLPRLTNGLPRYISVSDRVWIRQGDKRFIRFHLGLLNLYRILEAPGSLKLETITTPFTGDENYLADLIHKIRNESFLFFDLLPGFDQVRKMSLSPKGFILSRSASPSNSMSAQGIITDVIYMNEFRPDLWQDILDYLYLTKPHLTRFVKLLQHAYELGERLQSFKPEFTDSKGTKWTMYDPLRTKASIRAHGIPEGTQGLSQFAIKQEAAGKIRLFALLDSVTQSVLAPLHGAMFALLRLIPNDGTFDQEASIKRSMSKALKAKKAWSFDLTAATDRLPVILTAIIIEFIFKLTGIGDLWKSIMTNRDFGFNSKVAEKLGIKPGPYRYAVGQPMGGLSSWPGLALTHHWIVQLAAYRAYIKGNSNSPVGFSWSEDYEILGDDIVIFDEGIAQEYLVIMNGIGCEINLNKSISSPNKPVFEFAKRTVIGNDIVSGVSLNQLRAGWNVGSRVANALSFSQTGLLTSTTLLATVLSRYASIKLSQKDLGLPLLALLGSLYQNGKVTLRVLAHAIINPNFSDFDYESEAVGLPVRASLIATSDILQEKHLGNYPFSHEDTRDEIFNEYKSEFSTVLIHKALAKATRLYENSDLLLAKGASQLYFEPMSDKNDLSICPTIELPAEWQIFRMQMQNFFRMIIDQDDAKVTPEYIHDKIYDIAYKHAKYNHVTFEEANVLLDEVEALEFKYTLEPPAAPGKTVLETTPIISVMRNMVHFNKVKAIWSGLDFMSDEMSLIKAKPETKSNNK